MNNNVILGASGFVGKHLTRMLENCYAPSSKELNLLDSGAVQHLSQRLTSKSRLVILSALTPDRGKDRAAMEKNILMVTNLCSALEKTGAKQVVLISSDAVYPESEIFVSEKTRTDTENLYGLGHAVREKLLSELSTRLGISLLVLRPSAIYGAGDTHNSYGPNRFIKTAKEKGEISLFGDGSDKRDHLFVGDLVKCIAYGLEKELTGVYNINSGESVAFKKIAELVAEGFRETLGASIKIATSTPKAATFRHYDPTLRLSTFSELSPTPIADGIRSLVAQIACS